MEQWLELGKSALAGEREEQRQRRVRIERKEANEFEAQEKLRGEALVLSMREIMGDDAVDELVGDRQIVESAFDSGDYTFSYRSPYKTLGAAPLPRFAIARRIPADLRAFSNIEYCTSSEIGSLTVLGVEIENVDKRYNEIIADAKRIKNQKEEWAAAKKEYEQPEPVVAPAKPVLSAYQLWAMSFFGGLSRTIETECELTTEQALVVALAQYIERGGERDA